MVEDEAEPTNPPALLSELVIAPEVDAFWIAEAALFPTKPPTYNFAVILTLDKLIFLILAPSVYPKSPI